MSRTRAPGRGNDEGKSPEPGREAGRESASRGEGPALQGAEGTLDFILNVLKNYGRLLKYLCFERIPLAPGCGQRRVDGEDQ